MIEKAELIATKAKLLEKQIEHHNKTDRLFSELSGEFYPSKQVLHYLTPPGTEKIQDFGTLCELYTDGKLKPQIGNKDVVNKSRHNLIIWQMGQLCLWGYQMALPRELLYLWDCQRAKLRVQLYGWAV